MDWRAFGEGIQSSVRPIVTILLASTLSWGFIIDKISGEAYLGIVGMALAWWFRDREAERERAAVKAAAVNKSNRERKMVKTFLGAVVLAALALAPMTAEAQGYGSHRQKAFMRTTTCDNYELKTEIAFTNTYSKPMRIARTRISNSNGDAYTSRYDGLIMAFTFFGSGTPERGTYAIDEALHEVETLLNPGDYIYITYWCGSGSQTVWAFLDYTIVQ